MQAALQVPLIPDIANLILKDAVPFQRPFKPQHCVMCGEHHRGPRLTYALPMPTRVHFAWAHAPIVLKGVSTNMNQLSLDSPSTAERPCLNSLTQMPTVAICYLRDRLAAIDVEVRRCITEDTKVQLQMCHFRKIEITH